MKTKTNLKIMRTTLVFILVAVFTFSTASAQNVEGSLSINGFPRDGKIKEAVPVDIFKSFKMDKYKIKFNYQASKDIERGIVLFDMKTTVKKDGKTIALSIRKNWPWLPGDMLVPIEAFDLIPSLQSLVNEKYENPSKPLPKGEYEVILEMKPVSEVRGSIKPLNFNFIINGIFD